jgi:membrane fusion protein
MALELYRQEALDAQRQRHYGTGLKVRSPSLPFLTAAAALVAAAIVSFLILGQYTRKEHVSGYLAPTLGLIKVYTPQQGTVEKRVAEGQNVKQGEVLLVVSSERATASNQEAQAAMLQELRDRRDSLRVEQQKQAGIDALAADELRKRIAALGAELAQARAQYSLQQQRVASALRTVRRHEELVAARHRGDRPGEAGSRAGAAQPLVALQRTITGLMRDQDAARVELESSALKKANNAADRPPDLRDRAAAHRSRQPPRGGDHCTATAPSPRSWPNRTGRGAGLAAVVDPPRRGGAGSLSARAHARRRLHPAGPDRGAALPGLSLSTVRPLPGRGA